jgi:heat shock protein HslJ
MIVNKLRTSLAFLLSTAFVASVGGTVLAESEPAPAELTRIEWSLTSITAEGEATLVPDDVDASLHLDAGEANGSGGCNNFFGSVELDGSSLTFGPLGVTQMFCEGPGQEVEDAYLPALASVAFWAIANDGSLRLLDEGQAELLAFSAESGSIEGVTWLLREQAVGDTQAEIPEGISVSLRMEDGRAAGNGGCNRYMAEYRLGDSTIVFGGIGTTLMACQEPAGTVESTYLGNVAQVSGWASDGETLTFSDDDGNSLLTYDAAPEASVLGSWVAQGVNNGTGGVVSSEYTSNVTALFGPDGELTGSDGCNDYFTSYEVDGVSIAISDAIRATKRACKLPEGSVPPMEYYAALIASTTWAVGDVGDLQLRDDDGSLQLNYVPSDA